METHCDDAPLFLSLHFNVNLDENFEGIFEVIIIHYINFCFSCCCDKRFRSVIFF